MDNLRKKIRRERAYIYPQTVDNFFRENSKKFFDLESKSAILRADGEVAEWLKALPC